ncbi:hypothetical protein A6P39_000050 [Streptomyces sp. FXJ1.172]|uniref:hypothetical protein n=1 Tax=Streptomyces sp. FXJ1.172 TaxID=710705 RepID=UPI0007CFA929|nr:hypothetical protein [Streptomyces sp. FXJ1.172]WEO92652.1 hypothetical protein A6P39_000050 [Streptomyces sp. FXJ1.172]
MPQQVGRVADTWPDRVWRLGRWGLFLLLLSFVTTLLRVVPAHGSTRALVADIKAGRTHTVHTDAEGTDVTVRWSTGLSDDHSYVYRPVGFVAGTDEADREFRSTVTGAAGTSANSVRFNEFDTTYGAGGLGLLLPVTYVLLTPWTWLRFLALFAGALVQARMLTASRHRLAEGPRLAPSRSPHGRGIRGVPVRRVRAGGTGRPAPGLVARLAGLAGH